MKYAHQVPDRPEQINFLWSETLAVMDKVISKPFTIMIFYDFLLYQTHTKSSSGNSVKISGCTSLSFSTNENVIVDHLRQNILGTLVKIRVHLACYFRFLFPKLEHNIMF